MITSEGPHPSENSRQNCSPLLVLNLIVPRYRTFIQHWESSKQATSQSYCTYRGHPRNCGLCWQRCLHPSLFVLGSIASFYFKKYAENQKSTDGVRRVRVRASKELRRQFPDAKRKMRKWDGEGEGGQAQSAFGASTLPPQQKRCAASCKMKLKFGHIFCWWIER